MINADILRHISETYPRERAELLKQQRLGNKQVFDRFWQEERERGQQELDELSAKLLEAARAGLTVYTLKINSRDLRQVWGSSEHPLQGTPEDMSAAFAYAIGYEGQVDDGWKEKYHTPIIVTKGLLSSLGPAKRLIYDYLAANGFSLQLQFTVPDYMEMIVSWNEN